jgi:hypothetical protein
MGSLSLVLADHSRAEQALHKETQAPHKAVLLQENVLLRGINAGNLLD